MIAELYLIRKQQRKRLRARKVMAMVLLLKIKMYMRDRNFLHSAALLPSVREAPWYVMYREVCDLDLLSASSLTRRSFEYLLSRFKLFYKFKSGPSTTTFAPKMSVVSRSDKIPLFRSARFDLFNQVEQIMRVRSRIAAASLGLGFLGCHL